MEKDLTIKHNNKGWVIASIAVSVCLLACFVGLLVLVLTKHTFWVDKLNVLIANNRNQFWNWFFKILTYFGWSVLLVVLCLLSFIFKDKKIGLTMCTSVGGSAVLNLLVKYTVQRPRPELMLIEEIGFSFPSAHAMMSIAVYATIIYFVATKMKNKALKVALISAISAIIVIVGISRVYLGVHYFSDILAGWCLGLIVAICAMWFYHLLGKINIKPKQTSKQK